MKGRVGTACRDEFLKKRDNAKTTKEIKIDKTKKLKEIKSILRTNNNYRYVARILEMHTIDVLKLIQEDTLQFGTSLSKQIIAHLLKNGVNISEIAELYECEERKVLFILNNINELEDKLLVKEVDLAIKISNLINRGKRFTYISKELKLNKYKLFIIYNKYFTKYKNNIINFIVVKNLSNLGLTIDEIIRFYKITDDEIKNAIEEIINSKDLKYENKEKRNQKNSNNILDNAYKVSTNWDFYSIRSQNKKYK